MPQNTEREFNGPARSPRTLYRMRRENKGKFVELYEPTKEPDEPRTLEANWPTEFKEVAERDSLREGIESDGAISLTLRTKLLEIFQPVDDTRREGYTTRSSVLAGLPTTLVVRR